MNYKAQFTMLFVGLFVVVLTAILSFIYVSYADFRRDEFFERLREKSFNTAKLLLEIKEVDANVLKTIDQNSINKMYDEKILVFDEKNQLIYSSLDDETIPYSTSMIDQIRTKEDKYFVDEDGDEVVGVHYKQNNHDYVVLASAYDTYGIAKLENLKNLVIAALALGTLLIGLASYFYIRQVFKPIDSLNLSIQTITEKNLNEFIPVTGKGDELDKLKSNYNEMLDRLYKAFESQKAFVRHAAHELKTPLAVIYSKLEQLPLATKDSEKREIVEDVLRDVDEQAALIESLLLIQRLHSEVPVALSPLRIDELLDESVNELRSVYPDQRINIDIRESVSTAAYLTVQGNEMLLKICFRNLITNAALYATDNRLGIELDEHEGNIDITFRNAGLPLSTPELIFDPFYRQPATDQKPGHGLGLSIVKQISILMKGTVAYAYANNQHEFKLSFPHLR